MRLGQLDHHVIHLIWMHEYIRILQLISVARRTTHEATLHQGFDPATWRSLGWTAPLLCGSPCIIGDFNPKNSPGKGLTPHSNPTRSHQFTPPQSLGWTAELHWSELLLLTVQVADPTATPPRANMLPETLKDARRTATRCHLRMLPWANQQLALQEKVWAKRALTLWLCSAMCLQL